MADQHDAEQGHKFEVGDRVGLYYSDHENYVFDNPTGVITEIKRGEGDEPDWITVQVEAQIGADRVYPLALDEEPTAAGGSR